jgi:hypothetical protein
MSKYNTEVNFSRRFGKSIGKQSICTYNLKKYIKSISKEQARTEYIKFLPEIFKREMFLSDWHYYQDFDKFFDDFKQYILEVDDKYFNTIVDSIFHLNFLVKIFWLEQNDPKLKEEFSDNSAKEQQRLAVEKNGYKFDVTDEDWEKNHMMYRQFNYGSRNPELYKELFNLEQQLKHAREDDLIQSRTENEWRILYSLRHLYKNVVNRILSLNPEEFKSLNNIKTTDINDMYSVDLNMDFDENTQMDDLLKIKNNLENWLSVYQESTEGLVWHNPYSDKQIDSLEYFPRDTSKPASEWAYSKYFDLDNIAKTVVSVMLNAHKIKTLERKTEFTQKMNNLKNLIKRQNDNMNLVMNLIKYSGPVVFALVASAYYYFVYN